MTVKVTLDYTPEEVDYTFSRGDKICFKLTTGEDVEAIAVKQEDDGMIFCMLDCLWEEQKMNETLTNEGGYEKSDLREYLQNQILPKFPKEISYYMVPFENGDNLRIPLAQEILGSRLDIDVEIKDNSIEQWKPMKDIRNQVAKNSEGYAFAWYWVQNINQHNRVDFMSIDQYGTIETAPASYHMAIRPVFKLNMRK